MSLSEEVQLNVHVAKDTVKTPGWDSEAACIVGRRSSFQSGLYPRTTCTFSTNNAVSVIEIDLSYRKHTVWCSCESRSLETIEHVMIYVCIKKKCSFLNLEVITLVLFQKGQWSVRKQVRNVPIFGSGQKAILYPIFVTHISLPS